MSTIAEIEAAISQLPPEHFRALKGWTNRRGERTTRRMWTPEELTLAAQRMVDEPNPARVRAQWEKNVRGFYGDPGAWDPSQRRTARGAR